MKTALLIQGPLTYIDDMYMQYKHIQDRVIWSTWDDSAYCKFPYTKFSPKPANPGYGNSNLQFAGGLAGCKMADELGFTHILKIRNDFLINNIEQVLDEFFDPNLLNFLAFHNWNGGYLVDYMIGGPIDLVSSIWNYDTSVDGDTFAERVLYNRIMKHGISSVNYLAPKMIEAKVRCHSLKWDFNVTASIKTDSLFIYPDPIPKV